MRNDSISLVGVPQGEWPKELSCGQVASLFGVDPKTINRWAQSGKMKSDRTEGGHFRFEKDYIIQKLEESKS